jgi:SAM-dependent methyltransferase
LARLKSGTEELNYGREIVAAMAAGHSRDGSQGPVAVLDLGLGSGADLANIRDALAPREAKLFGVDSHGPNLRSCEGMGVGVSRVDIEREPLPHADGSIDIVVANQILEHTKEIFWIVSEVARVLKPGGAFLVGVPNLASLHSRAMLALGMQPSPIDVLGPHVRGFTLGGFERFVGTGGFLKWRRCGVRTSTRFRGSPQNHSRGVSRRSP